MRTPSTVNGGEENGTLPKMFNGTDLSRANSKSSDEGDGELKPITHNPTNGFDGARVASGGDEDEYLTLVDELSFKDERHKDILLARLNTLRRNRELCDVVLLVDKREIYAHKAVLAAVSPTLFEIFTQSSAKTQDASGAESAAYSGRNENVSNSNQRNVDGQEHSPVSHQNFILEISLSSPAFMEFNDVDFDCFDALISYAYTGSLDICAKKVADLYKTASRFRMHPCAVACAKYLARQLSPQNCIGIRKCANGTNDSLLASKVDAYIQTNFNEIFQNGKEFLILPSVQLEVVVCLSKERPDITAFLRERRKLGEKILDWVQQQTQDLPDHAVFRMEMLTEKTHMLFMDGEMTVQDCNDLDNGTAVAFSDLIQDHKMSNRRSSVQTTSVSKTRSRSNVPVLASPSSKQIGRVSSSDSMSSLASEMDEIEWKLIAISRISESYCTALAVIRRQLAVLSIHVIDGGHIVKNDLPDQRAHQDSFDSDSCSPLTTMEIPRCSVGAVCLHGKLLVCGGYDRGECLNSVEQYDPELNSWTMLPLMNTERGRFDAAVVGDRVYAIGGSDGARDLNTAEYLELEDKKWTKIAPMLNARSHHGVASSNGYVYAIGGYQWQRPLKNCERYDCVSGTWEPTAPLQQARYQAGCCALSQEIVAVGGFDTWNCINSVESYDPEMNSWRMLPQLGVARRGCGVAVVKDRLYAIGGSDGVQALCHVEILDLNDLQAGWRPAPTLNIPRDNVRAVVIPNENGERLYAVGGFNGKSFLNSIEYLDEGSTEWKTVVLKPHQIMNDSPRVPNMDEIYVSNCVAPMVEAK